MAGLGAQNKRKAEARCSDLTIAPPTKPKWSPPPPDECDADQITIELGPDDRVKVRMLNDIATAALVEFAVVQETRHKRQWQSVAIVDSSHDDEVHLHQYGRRAGGRVGDSERLLGIDGVDDIAVGYDLGYERIVDRWAENKARWHDG
jgi:hypothetical protein